MMNFFVLGFLFLFFEVVGVVDRAPRYENGKQKSALPNMVYESGYCLPFGSASSGVPAWRGCA